MHDLAFGFLAATAFVPWWSGASAAPKWIVLALFAAWLMTTDKERVVWTWPMLLGAVWLGWCALRFAYTWDGINAAIQWVIAALLFRYGVRLASMDNLLKGMLAGMAISSVLVIPQWFGWTGVMQVVPPAGLFMNKNFLAELAVPLLILGLTRGWRLSWLACAPAVLLPASRGAWVALAAVGGIVLWRKSKAAAAVLGCIMALLIWQYTSINHAAFVERLDIWSNTLRGVTLLGHGVGSFRDVYPLFASAGDIFSSRPLNAHNDYLEIAFETGTIGFLLFAIFVSTLARDEWLPLLAIGIESVFSFPLHQPATLLLAAILAGRIAGNGVALRWMLERGRDDLRHRGARGLAATIVSGWSRVPADVLHPARGGGILHAKQSVHSVPRSASLPRGRHSRRSACG